KTNNTALPFELVLEDGSIVKLAPRSSLSFPEHFINGKREVYLTGEAFFKVSKNPEKPFMVYYNNIVTRVLGTSFTIKTNNNTKDVEVSVRTGRVQVFENKNITADGVSGVEVKSVILKPNQKAMYNIRRHDFATTLADSIHPLAISPEIDKMVKSGRHMESFFFQKATSLQQIFSMLESVYGIEIIVDNENIYKCDFTGDVSTQEMLEKLHIICLTIGASYEVNGTKILVSGKGCN
ncbi:MAG TPA: FecR family protein, partial [Prolixibacteraceae bacterium]